MPLSIQDVGEHHPGRPTFDGHIRPPLRTEDSLQGTWSHQAGVSPAHYQEILQTRKAIFFHASRTSRHSQNIEKPRVTSQMEYVKSCFGYAMLSDAFCCRFGFPKVNRETAYQPSPYILETEPNKTDLLFVNPTVASCSHPALLEEAYLRVH